MYLPFSLNEFTVTRSHDPTKMPSEKIRSFNRLRSLATSRPHHLMHGSYFTCAHTYNTLSVTRFSPSDPSGDFFGHPDPPSTVYIGLHLGLYQNRENAPHTAIHDEGYPLHHARRSNCLGGRGRNTSYCAHGGGITVGEPRFAFNRAG